MVCVYELPNYSCSYSFTPEEFLVRGVQRHTDGQGVFFKPSSLGLSVRLNLGLPADPGVGLCVCSWASICKWGLNKSHTYVDLHCKHEWTGWEGAHECQGPFMHAKSRELCKNFDPAFIFWNIFRFKEWVCCHVSAPIFCCGYRLLLHFFGSVFTAFFKKIFFCFFPPKPSN